MSAALTKKMLQTARSTLKQAEEQLQYFQNKRDAFYARYRETGAQKQQFFYRSDANGLIQLQSDAAFVMESIFFVSTTTNTTAPFARFSLLSESAGREITHIKNRVPAVDDEELSLMFLSPTANGLYATRGGDLGDYWFYLTHQYLVPRSSVFRVRIDDTNSQPDLDDFVIGGYKVY